MKNDPNVETIEPDFAVKSLDNVEEEAIPVEEETIAVEEEAIPVEKETIAVEKETIPVEEEDIPVKEELIPFEEETIPWGVDAVSSTSAHYEGITGKGVKVAVFDTGINEHSDLSISGGISFVVGTESFSDDNGHGTHIAGIIASKINNQGITGVAPSVELYAVKVLDSAGNGRYSSIIQALDWAIENKINIINMGFGGSEKSKILEDALQMAYKNNILIFASAGNDGKNSNDTILYPAKYKEVIAVGAIDKNEERADFSSIGSNLELVAPGVDIESTLSNGLYGNKSGTSMAAPHAAGVAALLWSKDISLTNQTIRDLLNRSAVGLGDKNLYGNGLVNARWAMNFYNDFAEVKSGKKDKKDKIKKDKYPKSNKKQEIVDPIVTSAGVIQSYYLDTPHPYPNNISYNWRIFPTGNNATNIRVHFQYIDTESGYDYVTTSAGDSWNGSYPSGVWSSWSGRSYIDVFLTTDGSVTKNGFRIDQIEYIAAQPSDDYGNTMGSATNIQVGTSYSGNINYAGDVDYFKFTPTVSGNHVIGSTGSTDTYGYLYNSSGTQLDYNDDSNGTTNFTINWSLIAGQLYYIQVRHYSGTGTGAYGLKVTAPAATDDHVNDRNSLATTIIYNSSRSGIINYAGDIDYFKFTPTVSKSYVFKSTGSTDTYGFLFDSDLFIRENDDYGSANFTITQYLKAGRTYYLGVRHYSPTGTGAYSVLVTDVILGDESYNRQFTVQPYQSSGRAGFDQIISDVDNYGNQLNDFGSNNVTSFNSLVSTRVQLVGSVQDRVMHFARNKINRYSTSLSNLVQYNNSFSDKKWILLPPSQAAFHMNGTNGEFNLKFISPDGHFEAIYNSISNLLVTSDENMGTYNFVGPSDPSAHTTYDVNPFFRWGNMDRQGLNRTVIGGGADELYKADQNLLKYQLNSYAQEKYNYFWNITLQ